jgi:hypothetical protein
MWSGEGTPARTTDRRADTTKYNLSNIARRANALARSMDRSLAWRKAWAEAKIERFFDETVWIPQTPNDGTDGAPYCPLCHGTGDLLALKGKTRDTRTDW